MKKYIISIGMLFIMIVLGAVYVSKTNYYTTKYPPNFYINNELVSEKTPDEVNSLRRQQTENKTITFIDKFDNIRILSYKELGITDESDTWIEDWNPKYWFINLFRPTQIVRINHLVINYQQLVSCIKNLDIIQNYIQPQDAYIAKEDGFYKVIKHIDGNQINIDALIKKIYNEKYNSVITIDEYMTSNIIETPEMYSAVTYANEILNSKIILNLSANTKITIPKEIFDRLITIEEVDVLFDYLVIDEYVKELANMYNTINTTRTFFTSAKHTIQIKPSKYDTFSGWKLDEEKLVSIIRESIEKHELDIELEVPWLSSGITHDTQNDFGDTYIEISIDKQRLWYYVNGELLINTPIVTGDVAKGYDTPKGMFKVLQRATEYTMHGSYGTAYCDYMLRATWSGILIHDAHWRASFGGTIYKTNGSHGCINTPFAAMKQLYLLTQKNYTPIIIIW